MALLRRRVGKHHIVYDQRTALRLARFGHEATGPEKLVRHYLTGEGLGFRTRNRDLPGSPDLANRSQRWVVFVHGCFWHRHANCARSTVPTRNRDFWLAKFRANRRRDRRVVSELEQAGYTVALVWECEARQPALLRRRLARVVGAVRRRQLAARDS